jgi:hypothetical protein
MHYGLKDLPIDHNKLLSTSVLDQYLAELRAIRSARGLRMFVRRWRALYSMTWSVRAGKTLFSGDGYLTRGHFCAKKVLRALRKVKNPDYKGPIRSRHTVHAIHIAVPAPLAMASVYSERYGAPHDMILVQHFGPEYF